MKRDKLMSSMELIDEKYIEEAAPSQGRSRRRTFIRLGAIAACICLMLTTFGLWLFLPFNSSPPDVSRYSSSEYYPLIKMINELTYTPPYAQNNYQLYVDGFISTYAKKGDAPGDMIAIEDTLNSATGSSSYIETTDNQVKGVIEADVIKRSDSHVFYLRGTSLSVYSIEKESSRKVTEYTVAPDINLLYSIEAYLSEDCSLLTVIIPCFSDNTIRTEIVSLDVSDPTHISESGRISVAGYYLSSRLVDGMLLMMTNFEIIPRTVSFDDESTFVPYIKTGEKKESIPMSSIVMPDNASYPSYTVVALIDSQTLASVGSTAYLSYSQSAYVSDESVYLTHQYVDVREEGNKIARTCMTDISRLSYSGYGLTIMGTVKVEGYVKDQYSLDERDGILRVVTTTNTSIETTYKNAQSTDSLVSFSGKTNANLYCIDINTYSHVASVESFAPDGETVRSVRFDGNAAYVCTSVQLSDPVFFFDLSDLDNITVKDTGTIEGFSSSLINFGDGHLLGIGVGENWLTVKIEVYAESEEAVSSVCKYEIPEAYASSVYKAYFIDRENHLVGLSISPGNTYGGGEYYLLLHFNGSDLTPIIEEPLSGNYDLTRAVLTDGWFYMFSSNEFKALPLSELTEN